ncbi:hypothetical protein U14_05804 [Candidatus Moduliflexus flocculans]|uniref:Uncharacterized protein n=1 Tax=Candidatus Moduliflexus flocculans TaxID=1499966 RepID=A0A081BSY6_9BACT|nr:hypothetical protein U14_05804 [Candidatus Moduliflexus flocculans]
MQITTMSSRPSFWKQFVIAGGICCLFAFALPQSSPAIQPGDDPQQPQAQIVPTDNSLVPALPAQTDQAIMPGQQENSRAIMEQPRQLQRRFADNFLPQSAWHVTDPQDGLRRDGRVAVLEGMNSQVVYQFYKDNAVVNVPNQPDLTIYTHDKGGFDGPYNVFVANFGDPTWTQIGADVKGSSSFDLPQNLTSVELILIANRHDGATYIEAIEGIVYATVGAVDGAFSYFPEALVSLRVEQLDCAELERAKVVLTSGGMGYQLTPLGEIEVKWLTPIKNEWKQAEFHIQADGEYEIYATDSRGMENFIGRKIGAQSVDLPQNMTDVARVRIRNHNTNRPILIYAISGRR